MNKRIITTCMLVLVVSASGCFDTDGESAERMAVRDTDRAPQGEPAPPGKYAIHTPNSRAGFPFRVTLTRAQAYLFLIRHMAISDWTSFLELFGLPVRWTETDENATPNEREQAKQSILQR